MTNFNLILFEPYIASERRSISLFKMGCQSKHLFSYDSNLILRKIFIKVKQQWVNFSFCSLRQQGVILDKIEWLSSEFHIGDLIFWESQVAQISLFLSVRWLKERILYSQTQQYKLSRVSPLPIMCAQILARSMDKGIVWLPPRFCFTWNLAHARINDGWSGNAVWTEHQ